MNTAYRNQSQKLPYLSRVEYVEFTGTQFIQFMNLVPAVYTHGRFTIDYRLTDIVKLQQSGSNSGYICFCNTGHVVHETNTQMCDFNRHILVLDGTDASNMYAFYDGIKLKNTGGFQPTDYSNPDKAFILGKLRTIDAYGACFMRLFSFKFEHQDSEHNLDLIPVRFMNEDWTSEGAFYDKASKTLFRNMGSSPFVVGPDVKGFAL